jgi:hypothetical protein
MKGDDIGDITIDISGREKRTFRSDVVVAASLSKRYAAPEAVGVRANAWRKSAQISPSTSAAGVRRALTSGTVAALNTVSLFEISPHVVSILETETTSDRGTQNTIKVRVRIHINSSAR